MFAARLTKNVSRLGPWRRREGVTCYRAYDRDIPEVPVAVDVFAAEDGVTYAVLTGWAPRHGGGTAFSKLLEGCVAVVADVTHIEAAHTITQVREPGPGGELEAADLEASAFSPVVREGQARFRLQLGARRDPGLFLDHRPTRALVADVVTGKRLLNLFAYTGSFSVVAALAKAAQTTSVDLSASTCRWASENLALNNLRGPAHRVVQADAVAFLDDDDGIYDVIVIDPPSFSKSRRAAGTFDVQRDHPALLIAAFARLAPAGEIWFSCNRRDFTLNRSALPSFVDVEDLTSKTTPPDFRGTPHFCFRLRTRSR